MILDDGNNIHLIFDFLHHFTKNIFKNLVELPIWFFYPW